MANMDLNYFVKRLKKDFGIQNPEVGFVFYTKDKKQKELYSLSYNEIEYHKGLNFLSFGVFKIAAAKDPRKIQWRKIKEKTAESIDISIEALAERFKSYYSIDEQDNEALKKLSSNEIAIWMCDIIADDIRKRHQLLEDIIFRCGDPKIRAQLVKRFEEI